ncbi:branched-chain amino acid ABC transporter permease [Oscillibacter sp.]|uniref:branched-chain amino acid ABC transporter permease n=1 Tax=Oscillibacter sp. TaxID=1945593 RepID=UPI002636D5EF|nr:branched-chain amino acid ABC transporter permease [Oscillibacter sp.]MDD3346554.1 branched-chain amino acid ABC transporter permease [Oscillibacter sp.]
MTMKKKKSIFLVVVLAVLLAACLTVDALLPGYHIAVTVIKKATVYALVAVSMNLLNGFTGLFSLGQAGFMLLGAYAYGVLTIPVAKRASVYQYFDGGSIQFSLPESCAGILGDAVGPTVGMLAALLVGGVLAALMAYLIGLPVLRLKSDYLAIATLGFAEILRAFFQWNALGPITNGSNLLKSYPTFTHATPYVLLSGGMIAIIVLLINSTYGRAFKAIRDDEVAAEAMGINLARHKRLAFVISSFFAGIGGGMMAMYMGTIAAAPFKSAMTYEILLIVVIGGIGSITGSILASFLYIFSSEWLLRGLDSGTFLGISAPSLFKNGFRMAAFSVIIMAIVLFFRKGIMGDRELPDLLDRRGRKHKKEAAEK